MRLHEKGLVYRGSYMVNWSPGLQTGARARVLVQTQWVVGWGGVHFCYSTGGGILACLSARLPACLPACLPASLPA